MACGAATQPANGGIFLILFFALIGYHLLHGIRRADFYKCCRHTPPNNIAWGIENG